MTDHPTSLRAAREDTIDALCAQFARDALSLGELESRLARAREARTRDELRALLSDLAAPTPPVPAQKATPAAIMERLSFFCSSFTRKRMSFHPLRGISPGLLAWRPRSCNRVLSAIWYLPNRSEGAGKLRHFFSDSEPLPSR